MFECVSAGVPCGIIDMKKNNAIIFLFIVIHDFRFKKFLKPARLEIVPGKSFVRVTRESKEL
jgi:hypothetical protein